MNRPIESDYTSHVAYTRALEKYCNQLEQPATHGEPVKFVVSAVAIKDTEKGFNTQNKLYPVNALSREEAHGIVLKMLETDFPEHRLHTLCSYEAPQPTPELVQAAEQALVALNAMNPYPASKEDQREKAITALQNALKGTV